jgi:hypothetical protein
MVQAQELLDVLLEVDPTYAIVFEHEDSSVTRIKAIDINHARGSITLKGDDY